jgi:hypothetical protein
VTGASAPVGGTSRFPRTPSTGPLSRTGGFAAGVRPGSCDIGTGPAFDRRHATVVTPSVIGPSLVRYCDVPGQTPAMCASDTTTADGRSAG